ncbi:hypothetical protein SPSYN_03111 [Sporotomaculum syntrophicum]|uniref:Helicase C-terminal domain-containing protein n=1 Tax=Sporotomaculum syntrophicum TaxID=182264 RepID=A0A9D2WLQ8_9FIRM|nr:helicase-related protein [Sporotomaculum syntrophicum]KAF1083762.1 hypothetical protein SPSYN_03111 [Sporotomaculum syntrophicum]
MSVHINNREKIIQALREELVGPSPQGEEIDISGQIVFESEKDFYKPWKQKDSGEEILQRDRPAARYGVGVLYPLGTLMEEESDLTSENQYSENVEDNIDTYTEDLTTEDCAKDDAKIAEKNYQDARELDSDDFEISTANSFKPSSMAVSFLAEFPEGSELVVIATGGRYYKKTVTVKGKEREWWLRSPVAIEARFNASEICSPVEKMVETTRVVEGLDLRVEVFSRPYNNLNSRLLTVCLVNRTINDESGNMLFDEKCLFQSFFKACVVAPGSKPCIKPYPGHSLEHMDDEEKSLALLYRKLETYAVGHGCAASWEIEPGTGMAMQVSAECLPVVEIPSTTPDITRRDGSLVEVPMASLAGLVPGDDGFGALAEVIDLYRKWIEERKAEIPSLDNEHYRDAAQRHIKECECCANRMEKGLKYLKTCEKARIAFRLANHAMLLQQVHREPRFLKFDPKSCRFTFSEEYKMPDCLNPGPGRGKWRPFQIAFLLMSLHSAASGNIPERQVVELIWFPTGGGKTEAYLGLAAFSMFMRRLEEPADAGVNVLMRYTLRLLTAQQFQRASALICSMEYLRRQHEDMLGKEEFSIGIWLGGTITPNTQKQAIEALNNLKRSRNEENLFILGRCPWCGAQMGRYEGQLPKKAKISRVQGYEKKGNTVVLKCTDINCVFYNGLPVYVTDEDIYEKRPSLVIGTVDKFAMLAWRPQARSLFGIGPGGERFSSPPQLILQDELHLISGPLGSMVGLYETVIEELCTDSRKEIPVRPKIVCSTATIRRYEEQVLALYGRSSVALFPPPGLDASDSFFARYARYPSGELRPGKKYVGVHAPGLRSMQTVQVRSFTALLQAPVYLDNEERDPWWTLLLFFNSLRELGTTLTLFQSDILDYLKVIKNRTGIDYSGIRKLRRILELTSRLRGDQVSEAISDLEVNCVSNKTPVDACLASNIIEVGVDIDRLSLMCVVGQPKTTSQYIQVTGRVGRKWEERPGLVITLYNASKPRDRSHFEKFRSYHERLYAQVEPTSATPFSPPTLERALHAVMVSYARQAGNEMLARSPYPYSSETIDYFKKLIIERVENIDKNETSNTEKVIEKRARQWQNWKRVKWDGSTWEAIESSELPLLRVAGSYATKQQAKLSWPTPMSLRNVDAECRATITTLYVQEGEDDFE